MADTSVVARATRADGSVPYVLGEPNWQGRRIPDIRNLASTVQIGENQLIDVLILGDGFFTQAEFEAGLQSWINGFYALKVYDLFRGAFRVRALYRQSSARASRKAPPAARPWNSSSARTPARPSRWSRPTRRISSPASASCSPVAPVPASRAPRADPIRAGCRAGRRLSRAAAA